MPALLIIAHAPLASSLQAVARHTFPDCAANLQALDVLPDALPDDIEREARALLALGHHTDALILTDVFGATPCNVAQRLSDGVHVKVVTGVNVPMLWRSLCYVGEPLEALVTRAVQGATQGVMQCTTTKPQNQAAKSPAHDQVNHDHQQ